MLLLAGLLLFAGCMEDVSDARAGLTNDCSDCIDDTGGANTAPDAVAGVAATNEDFAVTITLNATDEEGDSLTFAIADGPIHGEIILAGDEVLYTPSPNFNGSDSFTFTASDGTDTSDPATVTITVNAVEDGPPVATDGSGTTDEDSTLEFTPPASDPDPEQTLTYEPVGEPSNGTVSCDEAGLCTYTPDADFNGEDSFTFTASDGNATLSNVATFSILVNPVNDAPTISGSPPLTAETNREYRYSGIVATDVDADDTLTFAINNGPGWLEIDSLGVLSGRPGNGDLDVTTGIEITVTDGAGDSAGLEEFDLTVIDGNEQPVATAGNTGSVDEDDGAGVDITLVGSDVDAGETATLTFQVDDTSPLNGTVSIIGNTAHYTPTTADFNGSDSFTFTVTDTSGSADAESTPATVDVTINPVQDRPVATTGITGSVDEDDGAGVDITLSGSDIDTGETASLTFQVDTGSPAEGSVTVSGNTAHYTPTTADYYGGDSFTFTVTDTSGTGTAVSTAATVDVTIDNTNDAPTITGTPPSARLSQS